MAAVKEKMDHKYYVKKTEEIRRKIAKNNYPPKFDKEKWNKIIANCYAYALDIDVEDNKKQIWFPGCIADETKDMSICDDVVGRVKEDLDFLGINYREDDNRKLNEGEYRIAVYFRPTPHDFPIGFHFSRQDADGLWSEKKSWKEEIRQLYNFTNNPVDLQEHGLLLESVLIISKK